MKLAGKGCGPNDIYPLFYAIPCVVRSHDMADSSAVRIEAVTWPTGRSSTREPAFVLASDSEGVSSEDAVQEIALLRAQGRKVCEIARQLGRAASTISRELRRNAATRSGGLEYRATTARWHAERAARRPKAAKLSVNEPLRTYVQEKLSGLVATSGGHSVHGPNVIRKKRRHGQRQHRRRARAWSPEQIARRLRLDFPGDRSMRISHEAICQSLYVQGRGVLRRELAACLRTGRVLRLPWPRSGGRGKSHVSPEVMISQRPAEAADRAVSGHWEGDLILGLRSSAIGTLVERTTRFTLLLHLPPMPGYADRVREKNGPALADHGAEAVRDAIARSITTLPMRLRRSLAWAQGAELSQHARLRIDTGVPVYFCDPHSPWQRGTTENTNGLLRHYFPKGTDLSAHTAEDLEAVAAALNARPRKALGWRTPAEALDGKLRAVQPNVATTARIRAIHVRGLRQPLRGDRCAAVDGLCGRRLRHRDVRELLRHARLRAAESASICLPGRSADGLLQLHRRLVQSCAAALSTRLPIPNGLQSSHGEERNGTAINQAHKHSTKSGQPQLQSALYQSAK